MVALNKVHLDCTGARTSLIDWQIFMMQQSQNVFLASITSLIIIPFSDIIFFIPGTEFIAFTKPLSCLSEVSLFGPPDNIIRREGMLH